MKQHGRLIRIVYALCLAGATINHLRAVLARGFLPDELPLPTGIYWSALTFLDPLAVLLLFVRPRAGVVLTAAIIVSDVVHNLWFMAARSSSGSFYQDVARNPFMMSQIGFMLFVAATARMAWRTTDTRPRSS